MEKHSMRGGGIRRSGLHLKGGETGSDARILTSRLEKLGQTPAS